MIEYSTWIYFKVNQKLFFFSFNRQGKIHTWYIPIWRGEKYIEWFPLGRYKNIICTMSTVKTICISSLPYTRTNIICMYIKCVCAAKTFSLILSGHRRRKMLCYILHYYVYYTKRVGRAQSFKGGFLMGIIGVKHY